MSNHPPPVPLKAMSIDGVRVGIYADREQMGRAGATHVVTMLENLLERQNAVRIVVGSAPSQDEFFHHLTTPPLRDRVDWGRVEVFHMDEYVGLTAEHPQSFRWYQQEHFVSKVPLKRFHPIEGEDPDVAAACQRYAALIAERPIDLVCLGIGENGHLAFNDPPVADFDDPEWVKLVELDEVCRQQQVNDGCFPTFDAVPRHAITLTLRVFAQALHLSGWSRRRPRRRRWRRRWRVRSRRPAPRPCCVGTRRPRSFSNRLPRR